MKFCLKCERNFNETENFCSGCGARLGMQNDISPRQQHLPEHKSRFMSIIAIIGAVLIFVGIAWMIAKNWHQIADIGKVSILVFSTLAAFVFGVFVRQRGYEAAGRALITLGALLHILSVFLIAQIYATPSGLQGYAWLLFLCWPVIILLAYLLDSPENLVLSLLVFLIWIAVQYFASIENILHTSSEEGGVIFSLIWIFLSAGALLYGLSILHNALKHKFTNIYRFWTVFYFLAVFYLLSFQMLIVMLAEASFSSATFSGFTVFFIIISFFGFLIGTLFATSKSSISFKEILGVLGILALLLILIFSTQIGSGLVGRCNAKSCYDFKIQEECESLSDKLICKWESNAFSNREYCTEYNCFDLDTEEKCTAAPSELECEWRNEDCMSEKRIWDDTYQECRKYNNQKTECLNQGICSWRAGSFDVEKGLPTSLWLLWLLINFIFLGFIVVILWYGQHVGSTKIINLGLLFFILDIITRYIGFWIDFQGYFAFSILAIIGGIILIMGSWWIPKLRRKLLNEVK